MVGAWLVLVLGRVVIGLLTGLVMEEPGAVVLEDAVAVLRVVGGEVALVFDVALDEVATGPALPPRDSPVWAIQPSSRPCWMSRQRSS